MSRFYWYCQPLHKKIKAWALQLFVCSWKKCCLRFNGGNSFCRRCLRYRGPGRQTLTGFFDKDGRFNISGFWK